MKKKQLHEALAVLLTKLSSARNNHLRMDNYVTKSCILFLDPIESVELHEAYDITKDYPDKLVINI